MGVRWGRGVVAVVLLGLIAGSGAASAAAGPSPSPAPGLRAGGAMGAVDGRAVIEASLAAFDGVTSYRYEHRGVDDQGSGMELLTVGTIITGDPFRSIRSVSVGGETGLVHVQVGGEAWRSLYGSGFAVREDGADPRPGPLDAWAASLLDAAEAGVAFGVPVADDLDGTEVLRFMGTTGPADLAASPDPMGGGPVGAQVELVVEAASGRLVEATVATQRTRPAGPGGGSVVHSTLERVRISGVDDPANDVLAPVVGPNPTAAPAGDPALAAVVLGALEALAAAPSWHAVMEAQLLNGRSIEERTFVAGPVPALEAWSSAPGQQGLGLRVIGEERWMSFGDPSRWQPLAAGASCFRGTCDLAGLRDVGAGLRPIAGTFTELPAETVDGVALRHLRSDAGSVGFDGPIPGTTDLWIDAATGVPARIRFDGQAYQADTRITNVGDPALAVDRPGA